MQANTEELELPAAPGNGRGLPVDRYSFKSVHLMPGTGAPSYTLEMSFDGDNWVAHGAAITGTADTVLSTEDPTNPLPKAVKLLRFVTNTAGGSAPKAVLFGHDPV